MIRSFGAAPKPTVISTDFLMNTFLIYTIAKVLALEYLYSSAAFH